MLGQCRRRWANNQPTLGGGLVFAGFLAYQLHSVVQNVCVRKFECTEHKSWVPINVYTVWTPVQRNFLKMKVSHDKS